MKGYQVNKLSSNGCSNTPFPFHDAICQCIFPQQRLSCRDRDNILLPLRRSIRGGKEEKRRGQIGDVTNSDAIYSSRLFQIFRINVETSQAHIITQLNSLSKRYSYHTYANTYIHAHTSYGKNKRWHEGAIVIQTRGNVQNKRNPSHFYTRASGAIQTYE